MIQIMRNNAKLFCHLAILIVGNTEYNRFKQILMYNAK